MTAITVKELANELGTDARTARKFLRSITEKDEQPGKGARWSIEKKELRSLRKKFNAFHEAQSTRKQAQSPTPVDDDAVIDEQDESPSDEALLAIEQGDELDD